METIRDQKFAGRTFVLDDVVFINCELKDCDLYYSGGDHEWINAKFEACRFHWRGPARNTVMLLQVLGFLKPPTGAQPQVPATSAVKPN
ncbi:MAG: hypothetical protein ABSA32_16240 [Candidatus Acidiferrales bacterium]|jgi:hypothetical protein